MVSFASLQMICNHNGTTFFFFLLHSSLTDLAAGVPQRHGVEVGGIGPYCSWGVNSTQLVHVVMNEFVCCKKKKKKKSITEDSAWPLYKSTVFKCHNMRDTSEPYPTSLRNSAHPILSKTTSRKRTGESGRARIPGTWCFCSRRRGPRALSLASVSLTSKAGKRREKKYFNNPSIRDERCM